QLTHFFSQCRLITHRGRHTTQQRRNFSTSQGIAVDVIHEEQDVATFVTEFFGHGQTRQRNTQTVTGWFVHLTEHHGYFRIADVIELNNTGFGHLVVEVV